MIGILQANPFKVSLNPLQDLSGFALAVFAIKPLAGIVLVLSVIATIYTVTQRNDVRRHSTGVIGALIAKWYPMIGSKCMPKPSGPAANSTSMVEILKASPPVFHCNSIFRGWISPFALHAACPVDCFNFIRIIALPTPHSRENDLRVFSIFSRNRDVASNPIGLLPRMGALSIANSINFITRLFSQMILASSAGLTFFATVTQSIGLSAVFVELACEQEFSAFGAALEGTGDIQHGNLSLLPLDFKVSAGRENPLVEWFMRPFLALHYFNSKGVITL